MDRRIFAAAATSLVALAATLVLLRPGASPADAADQTPEPPRPPRQSTANLPVAQVVLFSSGVGYFVREGEVEGNARVDLAFPAANVNDLLKSMVLEDLDGGHVNAVTFESHDPLDKTLQSFAVNLNNNPSLSDLLGQARGEKVEVVLARQGVGQPAALNGTVLGIEQQKPAVHTAARAGKNEEGVQAAVELLNLSCGDGLRGVRLDEIQRVKFLNPRFEGELQRALEVLAASHDAGKKTVTLNCTGQGRRRVRVGYVVETPLWRTTYRLVLGGQGNPFLQGWAVVENQGNEDWKDVSMALVSGRPISFQMDLYTPLYLSRPVVQPELFASIRPQVHGGDMNGANVAAGVQAPPQGGFPSDPAAQANYYKNHGYPSDSPCAGAQRIQFAPVFVSPQQQWAVPNNCVSGTCCSTGPAAASQPIDPRHGALAAAVARDLGSAFQYSVQHAVSLPRQRSAMVPILNKDVEAKRVSVYNEAAHPRYPLQAVSLKNTSGAHLTAGPVTVFDGGTYAGDAQFQDLQPNEERLVSYAIDLGTEVEPLPNKSTRQLTAIRFTKGTVYVTRKQRETRKYQVKNRSPQARTVLIEHPFRSGYKVVGEVQPKERARDVYRFELKVPAGEAAALEVTEETKVNAELALCNAEQGGLIQPLLASAVGRPKTTAVLEELIRLKEAHAAALKPLSRRLEEMRAIKEDQKRLRANLAEMPKAAAAYKRYLDKFDRQESEIEQLQATISELQEVEARARQVYEAALLAVDLEFTPANPEAEFPGS